MSLSRSNSREHLGSGSDSDNWRDHNGIGPAAPHDFVSSISSPKRKQNRSGNNLHNFSKCIIWLVSNFIPVLSTKYLNLVLD